MSEPIRSKTSAGPTDHANEGYRKFMNALRDGTLKPGTAVTQSDLCDALSMSLTPLRETLVLLEEHGLVQVRPRAGIQIVNPEVSFIRENYQFRIMIEMQAIRAFGNAVPSGWAEEVRQSHADSRDELSGSIPVKEAIDRFVWLDHLFHKRFVEALHNRSIMATHDRLQENIRFAQITHQRVVGPKLFLTAIDQHLAIIDCLEGGDIEGAVETLNDHFQSSMYRHFVEL